MTNKEYYKSEIIEAVLEKGIRRIAVDKDKKKIVNCLGFDCNECEIHSQGTGCCDCSEYFPEWLEQENKPSEETECKNCKHDEKGIWDSPCEKCDENSSEFQNKPKNYIKQFMADKGLEIGEEFGIYGINERYHFGSDYVLCSSFEFECPNKFQCLLAGELKPIKLEQVDWDSMVGKDIEVTNDKACNWHLFKFLGIFNGFYMTTNAIDENPIGWKHARLIKE